MNPHPSGATFRRLLGRSVKRQRLARPLSPTPHATDTNPNREFARTEEAGVWFFVFLPIFVLLYAIFEKMHVRSSRGEPGFVIARGALQPRVEE
jgi:hypothetical protein